MPVRTIVTGPFVENSYLVWVDGNPEAMLIDPGDDAPAIARAIESAEIQVAAILLTHCHLDHIGAVDAMRDLTGAPAVAHGNERELLAWYPDSRRMFGLPVEEAPTVDIWLAEEDTDLSAATGMPLGPLQVGIIPTPGHTAGGLSYLIGDDLFTGDTLFKNSIGRTDLPGGDIAILAISLTKLAQLPGHLKVYPGHGEVTTIKEEKVNNGYMQQMVSREVLDAE